MSFYYLMTTEQKNDVIAHEFAQQPFSSIDGSLWIVEALVANLTAKTAFNDAEECRQYVGANESEWDEFYNIL